ncbi:hypothetical protein M9428_30925 (plasmid) [Bacillus bombysepticus]
MKILLEGKRIFEESTLEKTRYLIFPKERIEEYVYIYGYLIKKGDFRYPKRWINTENIPVKERFVSQKKFHPEEYEGFIFNDWTLGKNIQNILKEYDIDIQDDINEFLKLEEITESVAKQLQSLFHSEDFYNQYPEEFEFYECYEYEFDGNKEKFIIGEDSGFYCTDITYDQTDWFFNQYITEAYEKNEAIQTEHLFQTDSNEWYHYYPGDNRDNYWIMEEIEEENLNEFPIHEYTRMEIEERNIPEKDDNDIDLSVYFAPETEYDFYFSQQMFLQTYSIKDGYVATANINGKRVWYTEMVMKGEEVVFKRDDLEYLGCTTFGEADVKNEQITRKDMLLHLFGKRPQVEVN